MTFIVEFTQEKVEIMNSQLINYDIYWINSNYGNEIL
jgi:hypothetical protein